MQKRLKEGKLYHVTFLDHSVGSRKLITCEVVGWFLKEEDLHLEFTTWRVIDDDMDLVEDNYEPVVIIKSCIQKIRVLPL